jgi:hypothetical protein
MPSHDDTFRELLVRLDSLRGFVAGVKHPGLDELDSLLAVAQAEVKRGAALNEASGSELVRASGLAAAIARVSLADRESDGL